MASHYDYEDGYEEDHGYNGTSSDVLDFDEHPGLYNAPPATQDLEVDAEEDVGALADALELNKKLKEIMSSGMEPGAMQAELNQLMSSMSVAGGDVGGGASPPDQHQQQQQHRPPPLSNATNKDLQRVGQAQRKQQQRNRVGNPSVVGASDVRRPPKGVNAGKTFSDHEAMVMAKNNQRLLNKMIKIQTSKGDTIGGYSTAVVRGSAVTNLTSSHGLNRKKRGKKISSDNQKFLARLQNVKSTMNTKKMRADADRNARISALRRQVPSKQPGSNNVFGRAADRARMNRFKAPPTIKQPAWET